MMHAQRMPWYRQFWPWFIIALPLAAVIASIATLIIAAQDPDGLVVDDYYKQGLAINETLERDRKAQALGLSGLVRVSSGRLQLTLNGLPADTDGRAFTLRLIHPTRPHLDRDLQLAHEGANHWSAELGTIAPGRWHVQVDSAGGGWRLAGRLSLPDQQQALLMPNAD
jgi:hypothetical protein